MLESIAHPFINKLISAAQSSGDLFLLSEVCLGGELSVLLLGKKAIHRARRAHIHRGAGSRAARFGHVPYARAGGVSDEAARFYVASVVSVLSYLHRQLIVYRDLKPENLMLDAQGYLKLVDFGFAKVLTPGSGFRTFTFCGSLQYLSPEMIGSRRGHSFGVDWWALGIFAFECLAGVTPFQHKSQMHMLRNILHGQFRWPETKHFSAEARDLISRLLEVEAWRRLGCLHAGSHEVRSHAWFEGLSFHELQAKRVPPPLVPMVQKGKGIEANFPESFEHEGGIGKRDWPLEDFPEELFADWSQEWV